jgi:two-component sensor histidine kinase/DNA-binding response OmpR family regulator
MTHKKLLLVDDEIIIALSTKLALEKLGYQVLLAHSGESAIETMRETPGIDLVLMDIDLGRGLDGTKTAEIILHSHNVPVIFLSSHTEPEIVEKTEKITSYGYIVKNSGTTILAASIKMAFKLFASQTELAKTTQLLEHTGALARVGGWQVDLVTKKLTWTKETFRISDVTPPNEPSLEEAIYLYTPEARSVIAAAVQNAMDHGTSYELELPIITQTGRQAWVKTQGFAEMQNGKAVRLYGTFQDITVRKMNELELAHVLRNRDTLINTTNDLMWSINPDYTLITANSAFLDGIEKVTGYRMKSGDSVIMPEIFPKEILDYWTSHYKRALTGESILSEIPTPTEKQDFNDLWKVTMMPLLSEGQVIGVCCYSRNISESKTAELKINSLLREKELILTEVHHRIKNNMGTIHALLTLQANSANEPRARDALCDAARRINTMTVLYDKLYKAQEFDQLSIKEYLTPLVEEIISNFASNKKIKTDLEIDDFSISTKKLQSIAIITNELVTNIMKYAFKEKSEGSIFIGVQRQENQATLLVQDDGIGFDEEESHISGGFGLFLIRELTSQLSGIIKIEKDNGTRTTLQFEIP